MLRAVRAARVASARLVRTFSFDALPDEEELQDDEEIIPGKLSAGLAGIDEPLRGLSTKLMNLDYTIPGRGDPKPEIPAEVVEGSVITDIADSISDIVKSLGD